MKNLDAVMDTYLGLTNVDAENIDTAITGLLTSGGAVAGAGIFSVPGAAAGFALGSFLDWVNLGKVVESVTEYASESLKDSTHILTEGDNPYAIFHQKFDAEKSKNREYKGSDVIRDDLTNESSRIDYIFKDGLLSLIHI